MELCSETASFSMAKTFNQSILLVSERTNNNEMMIYAIVSDIIGQNAKCCWARTETVNEVEQVSNIVRNILCTIGTHSRLDFM